MDKKAGVSTRESLLLAAERLFAQNGVDGASTRAIALAAGQRNVAALHYHFGNKEQLLLALLEMRLDAINPRREALLAEMDAEGRGEDIHALIEALVLPMLETLQDPDNHWVGLLQQLYLRTQYGLVFAGVRPGLLSGLDQVTARLKRSLAYLSQPVFEARLRLAGSQQIYSAADWYYRRAAGEKVIPLDEFATGLVDFVVAGLVAPVSGCHLRVGRPPPR